MSPTQRTLAKLRADGWSAFVVERWNSYAKIRQDLGGCLDILGWAPGRGVIGIQCTVGGKVADRLAKVEANENAMTFLRAGGTTLEVWGWRLAGPKGERKTWQVRRVRLALGLTVRDGEPLNEFIEQEVA